MSNELKKDLKVLDKHFDFLQKTYYVESMGLFGSVVRGQQTESSDVDIVIELSRPIGFFKFIELEDFLSKVLKKKVDLVTKKALKPAIKKEILKEAVYV